MPYFSLHRRYRCDWKGCKIYILENDFVQLTFLILKVVEIDLTKRKFYNPEKKFHEYLTE